MLPKFIGNIILNPKKSRTLCHRFHFSVSLFETISTGFAVSGIRGPLNTPVELIGQTYLVNVAFNKVVSCRTSVLFRTTK